ncbi:unnamed protein product [Phyllotreta striolata]|uniref:Nucleolar protein 16 n=1 Tax=Phyllotreta striolata TaxID=444603 RepID=A0A9N9TJ01_PHYSR|nr:unnamed protein product [Phyllotreta striolata]
MTKLRKQRKRKTYNHNVNRKRLRNKIYKQGNIGCKEVKVEWDNKKSMKTNLQEMGLAYDPNKSIKIPQTKKTLKKLLMNNQNSDDEEGPVVSKAHVVEALEEDAKAPREKKFRLPKGHVEWITYLVEKYGDDYKAMERDKKNYNQETWKQIRQKIRRFAQIPEQYDEFVKRTKMEIKINDNVSDDEI